MLKSSVKHDNPNPFFEKNHQFYVSLNFYIYSAQWTIWNK
jgi:hypothetical protein